MCVKIAFGWKHKIESLNARSAQRKLRSFVSRNSQYSIIVSVCLLQSLFGTWNPQQVFSACTLVNFQEPKRQRNIERFLFCLQKLKPKFRMGFCGSYLPKRQKSRVTLEEFMLACSQALMGASSAARAFSETSLGHKPTLEDSWAATKGFDLLVVWLSKNIL